LEQKDEAFFGNNVPAIRFNLFVFKEKTKRISTSIRAKGRDMASLLIFFSRTSLQGTKQSHYQMEQSKGYSKCVCFVPCNDFNY
jgi:hypothetical protein